jgi:pyruvate kinase
MVARGDLGVELPPEDVPIAQKHILASASRAGKIRDHRDADARVDDGRLAPDARGSVDVANAIFDGSDAVMLSAETASGNYPTEAVKMMARIIMAAEQNRDLVSRERRAPFRKVSEADEFTDALAGAANYAAEQLDAKFIVVFTQTGSRPVDVRSSARSSRSSRSRRNRAAVARRQ